MTTPPAARPAQFDAASQHRRSMIAKINVARHQLDMVEDDYRQLLFEATGATSLTTCSERQLEAMIDALKAKGFKPLPKGAERGGAARGGAAQHPMARKARALWISLHQLGVVHNPAEAALEAFAKRQLGCEKLVWARQSDGFRLIEALKAIAERAGWPMNSGGRALAPLELQVGLCRSILSRLKDVGAAPADWELHDAAWKLCGIENAHERAWGIEDYARLAAALGAKLRAAKGETTYG